MRTEYSYHDLFRTPVEPFEPTILLGIVGFRNVGKELGMGANAGSMVFNRLFLHANKSTYLQENFLHGTRLGGDGLVDLKLVKEVDPYGLFPRGKAGREILKHCQFMLDAVTAEPEPLDVAVGA